jgi:hypothetical protein
VRFVVIPIFVLILSVGIEFGVWRTEAMHFEALSEVYRLDLSCYKVAIEHS